jgi:hypothetical protein
VAFQVVSVGIIPKKILRMIKNIIWY